MDAELKKLPGLNAVLPLAQKEAVGKKLNVYVFDNEDLQKHFNTKYKEIGMITVSSNEDTAIWNIKNFKHSYLVNMTKTEV